MKHLLNKWTLAIVAVLKPLGIWGVMGFAAVDASFLGMPLDAIVAGYEARDFGDRSAINAATADAL